MVSIRSGSLHYIDHLPRQQARHKMIAKILKKVKRVMLKFKIDTLEQRIGVSQLAIDSARYRQRMARGKLATLKHELGVM